MLRVRTLCEVREASWPAIQLPSHDNNQIEAAVLQHQSANRNHEDRQATRKAGDAQVLDERETESNSVGAFCFDEATGVLVSAAQQ